jgi:hypothetical protein
MLSPLAWATALRDFGTELLRSNIEAQRRRRMLNAAKPRD